MDFQNFMTQEIEEDSLKRRLKQTLKKILVRLFQYGNNYIAYI